MTPQDFRRHAHAFVDWMADYAERVETYPVRARVEPGEVAARLGAAAPESGEAMEDIFRDFTEIVVPGMTHWQHPGFFAYFPANASPPSVLAEMLTAALGAQCMSWQTSPAATELETRVMEWLRDLIGLPAEFRGVIQDTASAATLCAIITARERHGPGATGALRVYCSEEAHSSVEKGVRIAGLGRESTRKIAVDERFAMVPSALEAAMGADVAAGLTPACVVATLGTTGASGFDPLCPIGDICRRHGAWFHVDAAWAGAALVAPEHRWMIDGIEHVDSFVFNPHKWLLTNFDCSAHFVRDAEALVRAFEILPEYLKTTQDHRVINYRDWGIPLGRRFRALKLWFVIRSYGVEGLRRHVRDDIELAHEVAGEVASSDDFEILAPAVLSLFCFRYRPRGLDDPQALDELNQTLLDRLNDSGALYLTHTRVNGAFAIRFCVGQTATERRHVAAAWSRIQDTARGL